MRTSEKLLLLAVAASWSILMPCWARAAPATAATSEFVVVANVAGPVTAYSALASGPVPPAFTVDDPNRANTYWAPWGIAVDAQGFLYVQTFLSSATTFVFAPGTSGGAPPARVFRGGGPDTRAIVIDAQGYEYIATGQGPAEILVLPPAANGDPDHFYAVDPLRSVQTDESGAWAPWPSTLTTDAQNHVIAAVVRAGGNAIEGFEGGPSGASAPLRVITGPLTGLDSCATAGCHTMAVTSSSLTGQLYVAVNQGAGTHISVFAGNASGNVAPLRSIVGPATGLSGRVVTGLAVSSLTGELYALIKATQFGGPAQISVFGPSAEGDVAPSRTFTDAALNDGLGIALVSQSVLDAAPNPASQLLIEPNPVRSSMNVRLSLAQPAPSVRIEVIDLQGRIVARLWDGAAAAGTLEVRWEPGPRGRAVRSGIYWVRAALPGFQAVQRVALIR